MSNALRTKTNLIGRRFGRLLVTSFAGSRGKKIKHSYWICLCNCGNEKVINRSSLIRGATESCGCLYNESRAQIGLSKLKDLTGQRFGKLVVIKRAKIVGRVKWECQCDCGNIHIVSSSNLKHKGTQSCGCYRTGRITHHSGYIYLHKPNHPDATKAGYIAEHRFVIQQQIGRRLLPNETVHHKNGIKADNRPENLELRCGRHGKHQSIYDMIAYAKEILQQYEPEALKCRPRI